MKESDRLELMATNIRAVGGQAEVLETISTSGGTDAPPRGRVRSAADHRVAMAFAVLGTLPGARVVVDDMACAAVSFPGFPSALRGLARRGAA